LQYRILLEALEKGERTPSADDTFMMVNPMCRFSVEQLRELKGFVAHPMVD
jgi:hypothetical protein